MKQSDIFRAWGRILQGRRPSLSIEITKECPLRCPGCYAFSPGHVGDGVGDGVDLRSLHDFKGDELVQAALALVDEVRPLHVSVVGGDPLVRYREMEILVPRMLRRGIFVQIVTSAFRPIPTAWANQPGVQVVVSIDGLPPEHDVRRAPATYERIRKNIAGHHVVVHCTVTAAMLQRPGYLEECVALWSENSDIARVWMSIFTPQLGETPAEVPSAGQRAAVIEELLELRLRYPKLDMKAGLIEALRHPPESPAACIFAQTTEVVSADLHSRVGPCQFGGQPDCSRCGCIASMGLAAIGNHRLPGGLRVGSVFNASLAIGRRVERIRRALPGTPARTAPNSPIAPPGPSVAGGR